MVLNIYSIRTSFLQSQGYSVIRIFNDEIFKNINNVLEYIYQKYLELKSPLPLGEG